MKQIFSRIDNFNRVEFWGATTIFVFIIFFHITESLAGESRIRGAAPFNYFFVYQLVRYVLLYVSFLFLNFYVVPKIIKKENLWLNIVSIFLVFLILAMTFGLMGTYMRDNFPGTDRTGADPYYIVYQKSTLYAAWLLMAFAFYTVIRYASIYLLTHSEALQSRYKFISKGTLVAFILWMISLFLLMTSDSEKHLAAVWALVVPFSIFFYAYSFHQLIPRSLNKRKPYRSYFGKSFVVMLIAFIPMFLFGFLLSNKEEVGFAIVFFNTCVQLLLVGPFTWIMYKRHLKGNEEVHSLKKELGRSNASIDFLRSQINPHFLFNALNTIYGTSLQEGAERTSAGIEKLGNMMRFMLQENMQEKIPLAREIEYLENYISLQELRTETKSNITINSHIEQPEGLVQIAPMLLIPFVENSFKHGISFREPSYINITLEMREGQLQFDVSNSRHPQSESDPEKDRSGIGLENVRQRLQLVYPSRHELVIRETKKDFFVHLSLKLS